MFPTVDTEENSQVTSLKEKSGVCSDERESSEDSEVAQSKNHKDLTLNMLFKETVICIALSLTVYGAIHSFPPKTSHVSQAVRFFSQDSVVTDWYRGQLSSALAAINLKEVSFVMYYAPWDAESQYVRGEFEKAANILKDRVHFFAINCWSPGSECRKLHSNILSWPVLITYSVTSNGMLYKGPRNAESIINFLELVMKPLKRVSSTEDLVNLLSIHDAVAVGYTPLTDTSKYYNIWYRVALESLEFDTIGEICFAVVTSEELAQDLGVDTFPSVRLMLWNETKEYKVTESQPWNVSALMTWVLDNFTQPVARMILPWRKAYNFDKFADGNPILMLFTPLNPLYEQLPSYALMREISMEYYSCKNKTDPWTNELIKLQKVQRLLYQQKDYLKFCKEFKFKKPVKRVLPIYKKSVISNNNKYPWNNVTQKNQRGGLFDFVLKQGLFSKMMASSDDSVLWSSLALLQECKSKIFPAEKSFYSNYEQCQLFEDKLNNDIEIELENVETTMLPLEDDPLSPENLMQANVKHFCKLLQFANELEPQVVPAKVTGNITHIHGLACTTNASLYIVAVDSTRNYHFAEALGIDIANKKDRTAVVILDSQQETQYVLSEEYNAKSVRDFIYNYTMGTLKRSLRTRVENASYTHYYESDNKTDQEKILAENEVQIIDLTTRTFRKLIRSPGTITIVAVCRGGCGAATSRAVLHAARLLAACGAPARVARLDALRHDLPWHYTAHSYPTLLVFTADGSGEAESRALPARARVSASALVALALRSLRAPLRFRVRLALCARQRAHIERKTCLKDIREHITTLIGRNLKYWRQTDSEEFRNFLLIRLQHLHQVSFHFSLLHVNDLKTNSERERILLQCLDELARHWDLDLSILRRNDSFVIEPR